MAVGYLMEAMPEALAREFSLWLLHLQRPVTVRITSQKVFLHAIWTCESLLSYVPPAATGVRQVLNSYDDRSTAFCVVVAHQARLRRKKSYILKLCFRVREISSIVEGDSNSISQNMLVDFQSHSSDPANGQGTATFVVLSMRVCPRSDDTFARIHPRPP